MYSALLKDLRKNIISYFKIEKNWEQSGFTLIELLVVIAIMGILTGGAIVAYNNFSKAQTVKRAALQVKSTLRESQNRAVSGLKHVDCKKDVFEEAGSTAGSGNPDNIGDYNLKGHYVAFTEGDGFYDRTQICEANPYQATPPGDLLRSEETIAFPQNVTIARVRTVHSDGISNAGCTNTTSLTVDFLPLQEVEFYGATDLTNPLVEFLCVKAEIVVSDGTTEYEIEVDLSGQVSERRCTPATCPL